MNETVQRILYGAPVAERINEKTKELLKQAKTKPNLSIIQVGDLERSSVYVRQKKKACEKLGIDCHVLNLSETIEKNALIMLLRGAQYKYRAVFIQLPLPKHLEPYTQEIINHINPIKDVDCLTTYNIGVLNEQKTIEPTTLIPATARGVIELLDYYNVQLTGKTVGVVGRSNLVGKPLIPLLLSKNATVLSMNSYTQSLLTLLPECDIVITAIGRPHFFDHHDFNPCSTLVDVGINSVENGKGKPILLGDVNTMDMENDYTPVPKGIGVTTVASLMYNVALANLTQETSKE